MTLDIHTHHQAPQPQAIISVAPPDFHPIPDQLYSIGIHPWTITNITDQDIQLLHILAKHPQIVAIGEAGIDTAHPGAAPMFRQLNTLRQHILLSEALRKPLILHDVKAHDIILALHRDLAPKQPWVIHGFRGKPSVMQMLLRPGIHFAFGEKFNPDTLRQTPTDRILAETDESPLTIAQIIDAITHANTSITTDIIAANTARLLNT